MPVAVPDDDEDIWSDAHDTMEDDRSVGLPAGIEGIDEDLTLKITTDGHQNPSLDSGGGTSLSTNGELASDAASVHSLPTVHVSHPQARRPSTARTVHSSTSTNPPSPLAPLLPSESSLTTQDRRNRHRSAVETRSPSRLSGFFTNLMHRRDPMPSPSPRSPVREERPSSPPLVSSSNDHSRSSSPVPRPVTPPPPLPAPTLQDLGLSLSVLTLDLSPSHFGGPPWSGALLGPHYLLLCHAQGLDVLPLVSPPARQPYALVRRVSFKSVVIMEQRGVLVAIAGRRDGVRVYALEEVKKAVEWRIEVEVRREHERTRREAAKKVPSSSFDSPTERDSVEKKPLSLSSPPSAVIGKARSARRASVGPHTPVTPVTPAPKIPRTPTIRTPRSSQLQPPPPPTPPTPPPAHEHLGRPPPYSIRSPLEGQSRENDSPPVSSIQSQSRHSSVSNVLAAVPTIYRQTESDIHRDRDQDSKADWIEAQDSSDDEAIDIVAVASSGSQALDERTSTRLPTAPSTISPMPPVTAQIGRTHPSLPRRNRPANLDLTLSLANTSAISPPEPSPTPTLLTLRQALSQSPGSPPHHPQTPDVDLEEDDDDVGGITLAQALMESRLPDLPPVGSRRPQQPILFTSSHTSGDVNVPSSPRASEPHSLDGRHGTIADRPGRRRRRWSVLDGMFTSATSAQQPPMPTSHMPTSSTLLTSPAASSPDVRRPTRSGRPHSSRPQQSASVTALVRSQSSSHISSPVTSDIPPVPDVILPAVVATPTRSRFIPRIISNAFNGRRSDDHSQALVCKTGENDNNLNLQYVPPPKLEYVKLPGTKGSILIKAVETAKKSFLAILCGDNGEKVELFAGTYRTALGLSRTFILPDSPRSLELQLQGDDLVEVFLVFSQNVFGLEPATVRVREVRIGRAERRAARRRVREIRTEEPSNDIDPLSPGDEDVRANVSIGVSVAPTPTTATGDGDRTPPLLPGLPDDGNPSLNEQSNTALAHAEELVSLATTQMGPYTTFQQLSFAPKFPLASIADDYIIPPTYPDFLQYRSEYEPEINGSHTSNLNLAHVQFSPPGLPVPGPSAPSKWFYRDPKDIIHGPWKASLMQAWYKDGLLPPDLPVRREEENDYVLLKDLRLQCVDPTRPFRSPPTPLNSDLWTILQDTAKPLLNPISLLSQPKHFGPPALFFSSRGGHSTTIVDARGRSVLKGRFLWSGHEEQSKSASRMGDVKRLEAFDIKDRAVLVAMRQGGLEAMDLGDALLRPADESRTVLPQFSPPPSNTNRRGPFVWRIGTPVSSAISSTIVPPNSGVGHQILVKKTGANSARSPAGKTDFSVGSEVVCDTQDDMLFLGRKGGDIYICERNPVSFRILRLRPT